MDPTIAGLVAVCVAALAVAVYAFLRNAALKAAAEQLRARVQGVQREAGGFAQLEEAVKALREAVESARSREHERAKQVEEVLAAVKSNAGQALRRVDDLVGRVQDSRRRGELDDGWLVAGLVRMGLKEGVHFSTQRRIEIPEPEGMRERTIAVCLALPDGQEIAIDDSFRWSRYMVSTLDASGEYARGVLALRELCDALREHLREVGRRGYESATNADIRHVLVVAPDLQTLQLMGTVDAAIGEFAAEQGVRLLPQEALYEMAGALAAVHREQGWSDRVHEIFTPEHVDRMFAACLDYLERMRTAIDRYNSLGQALEALHAPLAPNGAMLKHVFEPAAQAAERTLPDIGDEIRKLDGERLAKRFQGIEAGRPKQDTGMLHTQSIEARRGADDAEQQAGQRVREEG